MAKKTDEADREATADQLVENALGLLRGLRQWVEGDRVLYAGPFQLAFRASPQGKPQATEIHPAGSRPGEH